MGKSPLGWARECKAGDSYSYEANGMVPVLERELDALIDACAERGLELFADDKGLRVEQIDESTDDPHAIAQYAVHERLPRT
jgi:hypothetical protein